MLAGGTCTLSTRPCAIGCAGQVTQAGKKKSTRIEAKHFRRSRVPRTCAETCRASSHQEKMKSDRARELLGQDALTLVSDKGGGCSRRSAQDGKLTCLLAFAPILAFRGMDPLIGTALKR
jgi:hypothetical protein